MVDELFKDVMGAKFEMVAVVDRVCEGLGA